MSKTKRAIPTPKQLEALKWVYFMGLSHKDAAIRMGVSRGRVSALIKQLGDKYPDIKGLISPKPVTPKKKISFVDSMSCDVWEDF